MASSCIDSCRGESLFTAEGKHLFYSIFSTQPSAGVISNNGGILGDLHPQLRLLQGFSSWLFVSISCVIGLFVLYRYHINYISD